MQVQHLAALTQSLKTVRETLRNHERSVIGFTKDLGVPTKKRWRPLAKIDRHIKDLTPHAANELRLRVGRVLKMKPPHRTAVGRARVIDLLNAAPGKHRAQFRRTIDSL
jgi:hypothetical protein